MPRDKGTQDDEEQRLYHFGLRTKLPSRCDEKLCYLLIRLIDDQNKRTLKAHMYSTEKVIHHEVHQHYQQYHEVQYILIYNYYKLVRQENKCNENCIKLVDFL